MLLLDHTLQVLETTVIPDRTVQVQIDQVILAVAEDHPVAEEEADNSLS
jgi:hypothetical protein